jgi:hypothetical protein
MTTKEKQVLEDRGLIRWPMLLGSGLIAFGQDMPRTLRQLWAEEDEAREPEPRRRQRRIRPPARQVDRLRRASGRG